MNPTEKNNSRIFRLMSVYLNLAPDYVTREMMDAVTGGSDFGTEYAFASLVASACGVDLCDSRKDKQFFRDYFLPMISCLDTTVCINDPYYRGITFPEGKAGKWSFERRVCRAYEGFVYDDPRELPDGRVIPQIGFFREDYSYPVVLENGREWMTLMPNEIHTAAPVIAAAHGKVLTFGLGIGYFSYMAARKDEVSSVTVVERSRDAAALFRQFILPQFPHPEKVRIIEDDAFLYAENEMAAEKYDVVFTDLWHDPSDGVELYLRMKKFENKLPDAEFYYWIEKTLKLYM